MKTHLFEIAFPPYIFRGSMLQCQLLRVPVYDQPNDIVCCASELEHFKDIGAIEVFELL